MRSRYENWVGGLNGDWLISRQRYFGIPFPVWYPLDGDGEPDYAHPLLPREDELPLDPSTAAPSGYAEDQRGKPRRLHRRPRRDGHLGDVLADPADRGRLGVRPRPVLAGLPDGPVHPGARHHPDLAVLARGPLALRAPAGAVVARHAVRLDPRPRPQEDVEVQGQRRGPQRDPRPLRDRRRPLARRDGPPRHGLAVRRDPDEGRPPAGHEGPQRLEVRPRRRRRHRAQRLRRLRARRLRPARPAGQHGHGRDRGLRGLRLHHRPRGHRALLLGVLRRLPRAGQGARVRRLRLDRRPLGPRHPGPRAAGAAPAARAVPALRDRGGLVVVAGGLDPPRRLADPDRPRRRRRGRPLDPRRRRGRAHRHPRGQEHRQGLDAPRAHPGDDHRPRRPGRRRPSSPPTTSARPAGSPATWSSWSTTPPPSCRSTPSWRRPRSRRAA